MPVPPAEAAAQIAPTPFLVVHGDQDVYFPVDHAHQLYEAASDPKELWVIPGFGHAERGVDKALADRIGRWVQQAAKSPGVLAAEPSGRRPAILRAGRLRRPGVAHQGMSRRPSACCAAAGRASRGVAVVADSSTIVSSSALRPPTRLPIPLTATARDGQDLRDTP